MGWMHVQECVFLNRCGERSFPQTEVAEAVNLCHRWSGMWMEMKTRTKQKITWRYASLPSPSLQAVLCTSASPLPQMFVFRKKTRPGCLCCPREAQRWVPTCLIPTSSRSLSKGATDFNFQEKIVFKGERKSSTLQRKYSRVTEPEPRTQKQEFQAYSTDQQTSGEQNQEDDSSSMDYRVCLFFSFDIVSLFMESIRKVLSFIYFF